jgi:hypothetical protein
VATAPAFWRAGTSAFMAGGAGGRGEAAPGDHLQIVYRLWLFGHQLEHGRAPWLDPYSFRPESAPTPNPSVWPFGLAFWPLDAAFGATVAWNVFVLLALLAAGLLACAWLRELGLPRGPALVGGLVFELAPYRVEQSAGHLLGAISMLLPLALYAFERARRESLLWLLLSGLALASIPLSGQVHLALGAIPFFALYAVCRSRDPWLLAGAAAGVVAAVAGGLLIRHAVIAGSLDAGGRSLAEVTGYSATGLDFVTRHARHGSESFVFLGWLTPIVAIAGLLLLARRQRYGLLIVLAVGAAVPILLSLGTNLPTYSFLWHHVPPLRYPRVPERLMPIACLALGALVAFAVAELLELRAVERWLVPAAAVALVAFAADLRVELFHASSADAASKAYDVVRKTEGRHLELPVFLPDVHLGSVYLYYDIQAQKQRPGGYSTTAPVVSDQVARRLRYLNCGDWSGGQAKLLKRDDVTSITLHLGQFSQYPIERDPPWFAWQELLRRGWEPQVRDGGVVVFTKGGAARVPNLPGEPPHQDAIFCEGWWPEDAFGHQMAQGHSPFWIYGAGALRMIVRSAPALAVRLSVDGHTRRVERIGKLREITLELGRRGWHLVAFDAHIPKVNGRAAGARLIAYTLS